MVVSRRFVKHFAPKNPNLYHWKHVRIDLCVSEEERDGVPDIVLLRNKDGAWHIKRRTSEHWETPTFLTLRDAKDHIKLIMATPW